MKPRELVEKVAHLPNARRGGFPDRTVLSDDLIATQTLHIQHLHLPLDLVHCGPTLASPNVQQTLEPRPLEDRPLAAATYVLAVSASMSTTYASEIVDDLDKGEGLDYVIALRPGEVQGVLRKLS